MWDELQKKVDTIWKDVGKNSPVDQVKLISL